MNQRPDSPDTEPASRPTIDPVAATAPSPPPGYPPMAFAPPKQSGVFKRVFGGVLVSIFLFSLILNVYMAGLIYKMTAGPREVEYAEGDAEHRIVILPVRGLINDETSSFIHNALEALKKNPPAAVILRVDSGGGMVGPSDRIWHELVLFKKELEIPVIASFGSVAASGGYYIAAASDLIVAEPTCITGSIGVMAQAFTVEQLLGKIGVTPEVLVATGSPQKDVANNLMRPWTDTDRDKLRMVLDHAYEQFVTVVEQGRGQVTDLTSEQVRVLADGRIFTADVAKDEKLIDEVGYLDDAIRVTKESLSLPSGVDPQVTVIGAPQSLLSSLLHARFSPPAVQLDAGQLRQWANEWSTPQILYLWQGG